MVSWNDHSEHVRPGHDGNASRGYIVVFYLDDVADNICESISNSSKNDTRSCEQVLAVAARRWR